VPLGRVDGAFVAGCRADTTAYPIAAMHKQLGARWLRVRPTPPGTRQLAYVAARRLLGHDGGVAGSTPYVAAHVRSPMHGRQQRNQSRTMP
jgi:hypothetical protein